MKRFWKNYFPLILCFIASAGFSLWYSLGVPKLVFEPALSELVAGVPEGREVRVPLRLVNASGRKIRIASVKTSCACISVLTTGERLLESQGEVVGNAKIPVEVSLATYGLSGARTNVITVEGFAGTTPVSATAEIKLNILPALRADPFELNLKQNETADSLQGTIEIADGYDDPGIEIVEVRPSDENLLAVTIRPVADATRQANGLVHRYNIDVRALSFPSSREHFVDVIPRNEAARTLRVPIVFQPLARRRFIQPDSLVLFSGKSSEVVDRLVRIHWEGDDLNQLQILSKPSFVDAEFVYRDEGAFLHVQWVPSDVAHNIFQEPATLIFGTSPHSADRCVLKLLPELAAIR